MDAGSSSATLGHTRPEASAEGGRGAASGDEASSSMGRRTGKVNGQVIKQEREVKEKMDGRSEEEIDGRRSEERPTKNRKVTVNVHGGTHEVGGSSSSGCGRKRAADKAMHGGMQGEAVRRRISTKRPGYPPSR